MASPCDTCPNCCRRGIRPTSTRTRGTQIVSRYRCGHCGHGWFTSRLRAAYPSAA